MSQRLQGSLCCGGFICGGARSESTHGGRGEESGDTEVGGECEGTIAFGPQVPFISSQGACEVNETFKLQYRHVTFLSTTDYHWS